MSKRTPLYPVHVESKAKIVEFAGYEMPINYPLGVIKEHEWTRTNAGLFDVSHMGQAIIEGETAADYFSTITPSPFQKTPHKRAKYTVLTNEHGGIIDDLIITRLTDTKFFVVFNAGCKEKDIAWMQQQLPEGITFEHLEDRALIALQGEKAETILNENLQDANLNSLPYMTIQEATLKDGTNIYVSRLGYTGEDGFEISIPGNKAPDLWRTLAANKHVEPVGLAARDSLRLEMGYPLYGHDLNDNISPIEANLAWVVGKTNTTFIGAERILKEREEGPDKKRIGIKLTGKGIAREGATILNTEGETIGTLTSGGFSPTLQQAIGQGYVTSEYAEEGKKIIVKVRGRQIEAITHNLFFIQPKTKSMKK